MIRMPKLVPMASTRIFPREGGHVFAETVREHRALRSSDGRGRCPRAELMWSTVCKVLISWRSMARAELARKEEGGENA
jgi:hypothetical protein